jgi:hypothetical protein
MNIYRNRLIVILVVITVASFVFGALAGFLKIQIPGEFTIGVFGLLIFASLAGLASSSMALQRSNTALLQEVTKLKLEMEQIKKAISFPKIR